jgi:uncharacterized membrane protein
VACSILVLLGGLFVGQPCFLRAATLAVKAMAIALFSGLPALAAMIMLSAVKDYNNIVVGFAVGATSPWPGSGPWSLFGLYGGLSLHPGT